MKSGRNLMIAGVASALAVSLIPMMPFAATAAETSDDTAGLSSSDSISIDNAVKTTTSNLNAVYNAVYAQTSNPKSRSAQNRVDRSVDALHASDAESNALKKQGAEQLETVRSMSKGDRPLTVDKVTIVQEGNVSVQSNSGDSMVVATADLRITRHIFEDDVDWEEIVPHRFTIDTENNTVVNILAEDQNWQDTQSTNEAVSSENRSSDEDESGSIDDEYAASNDSDAQFKEGESHLFERSFRSDSEQAVYGDYGSR
ncbi:hypothetical protein Uis1B_0845 [Bifidobacterium margollesii]|uniref:Uncharacterized protein n=1 Tax=Bifidobacterium margollesii TaxID=2020964 RepID=A0A2N5JAU2_9BIFI|nr:hypothetical protein [Bifidobacterium margollesii]PLS31329.1 hypothetical protein Uis1B_0845 [Bifidobacterium margollesii]